MISELQRTWLIGMLHPSDILLTSMWEEQNILKFSELKMADDQMFIEIVNIS